MEPRPRGANPLVSTWARIRTSTFWFTTIALILRIGWIVLGHTYRFKPTDDNFGFGFEMGRIAASIASGLIVIYGFLTANRMDRMTAVFLATTVLTSVTGFAFPNEHITPGIVVGILSIAVLGVAILTRYALHLRGASRWIFIVTAALAEYFNCFVLVVQSFEKSPTLRALAPTQKEPPFAISQLIVLVFFVVVTALSVKRFRLQTASALDESLSRRPAA